jgi:ArsR family transcriptional regulator
MSVNIEQLFRALADRTRLRLLNLMGDDEVCVCFFVEILRMSQPRISRHLAYMKKVGIVASRREGKWMHYRIVPPTDADAERIFADVRQYLDNNRDMQSERKKLVKFSCATDLPVTLQYAPLPVLSNQTGSRAIKD